MIINISYDPTTVNATTLGSATKLAAFEGQVNAAAQLFENAYLDPVSVNITVKYAAVGLGQSNQSYYSYSLSTVKDALKKDITSLDDLLTQKTLGTAGTIYLTHAQLKALGLIAANTAGSDGTITFDNTPGLIDFTHSAAMSATSYDLYGVAAHEISEIMGRGVDVTASSGGVLHTVLTQYDVGGNLKIGTETLLKFNTAATGDKGDWDSTVAASDAYRAFANPGTVSTVSPTDMRAVDIIGWDHKALDLVFAIDTTGSMGPYIDNVKANAISIVNAAFGTDAAPIDTRIGIVGFKDAAGPNGPGENTDVLNFTEQDTYAARKSAATAAINSLTVGGGGDIPEGDNSALLFALQGNLGDWRRAAQDHKIILFSDAPIKDTGLAAQVAAAAAALGVTVTASSVESRDGFAVGSFSFSVSSDSLASTSASPGDDAGNSSGEFAGPTPATINFSSQVFAIQVGSDSSASATLSGAATSTGGSFFSGDATNLSDIIKMIISLPPPPTDFTIVGTAGDDTLDGAEGNDTIAGLAGNDTIHGKGGNDFIDGGPGADTIDGGTGFDLASWLGESSGLTLNLANQALNAGSALGDTVTNVEAFYLTNFVDSFTGGSTGVFVYGFDGNDNITGSSVSDIIDGGPGSDTIDAGAGFDYVSYYSSANAVTLDLKNPANNTGDAKGDVITNAEAYILTSKDDTFIGTDSGQNIVFGYEGNDTLKGGFNANNWFFAGDGNDRMVGGGVQDLFVGGNGADTIVLATPKPIAGSSVFGFTPGTDVLEISRAVFGLSAGYAVTAGSTLVSGTGPVATTAQPTFFYYTNLGLLYFDPDGTGSTAATLLAQFDTHPALTAADFHLV
jgi:Ca2+-binding RTX toxin-like protein